jgi:hypothetical protein
MRKYPFLFVMLFALCSQAQNREMIHTLDVSYGLAIPMGDFKGGFTENLSGGNALSGSAFNITLHTEIKEFIGGVFKFGYQQNDRRKQSDHDYFSNVGPVEIYADDHWRINHLALGAQVITPVTQGINADFYVLLGVQWGYVPELEMVYYGSNYTIQNYFSYSPFLCPSGIIGADIRVHLFKSVSFLANTEFMFSKPKIEYTQIYSYNGNPRSTSSVDKKSSLPINILNLTGGISLAF